MSKKAENVSFSHCDLVVLKQIVTAGDRKHFVGTKGLFVAGEDPGEQSAAHVLLEDNRIPGRAHSVEVLIRQDALAKAFA